MMVRVLEISYDDGAGSRDLVRSQDTYDDVFATFLHLRFCINDVFRLCVNDVSGMMNCTNCTSVDPVV